MKPSSLAMRASSILSLALFLAGCGGGGSSSPPVAEPTPRPAATATPTPTPIVCNPDVELCWPTKEPSEVAGGSQRPRVILTVMLDDADYNDFGYYSVDAVTPAFDRMARRGVVLSRYYAASGICSPTRASIITGNSPIRYGLNRLWPNAPRSPQLSDQHYASQRGLPRTAPSIGRALSNAGYRSFHIGKWHLGTSRSEFLPTGQGFADFRITRNVPFEGDLTIETPRGLEQITTPWRARYEQRQIIDFLGKSLDAGEDVFINWWPSDPHTIRLPDGSDGLYVPPTFNRTRFNELSGAPIDTSTDRGKLLATMFAFDAEFARITNYLSDRGLLDDTLIVVTSDNGGWRSALSPVRPVSSFKGTLDEGGVRVPFLVSWPNRLNAETHTDLPMQSTDLLPTLLGLVGLTVEEAIDGQDLSDLILNGRGERRPMYFEMRRTSTRTDQFERLSDSYAVIDGCDKVVVDRNGMRFFNVCENPSEDIGGQIEDPQRREELAALLLQERLEKSLLLSESSVTGPLQYAHDERFNVHQDDLSIYADVAIPAGGLSTSANIYQRGDGVRFEISNGRLQATLVGAASAALNPELKRIVLSAPMPADSAPHTVGLVVRGYTRGASSISLFIDGQAVDTILAPLNAIREAGPSIMAIKSERVPAVVGNTVLPLGNFRLFVNALEPRDFK